MATRQVRIFTPPTVPFDGNTWAETALGRIIRPLVENSHHLDWFWFSRYVALQHDSADCDISKIPSSYFSNGLHCSLRFRCQLPDEEVAEFETKGGEIIRNEACEFSHWMDYGFPGEFGGSRFLGGVQSSDRSVERAKLMAQYVMSVSKLVLHGLVGPDSHGRYGVEHNTDAQNPLHSSFESMHHLFCNITNVPLEVDIFASSKTVFVRSAWSQLPPAGFQPIGKQSINF